MPFIPLLPPSSGRRWRVAPEVGFALFRLQPTPCPSGIPLPWEGGRWVTHPASPSSGRWEIGFLPLLPPSFGRRWRIAQEVGFALFRLRPTSCPSGIPLPSEGGRWVTHPASPSFLWKEVARSAGGWLSSFSPSANPPALRASPFHRKGGRCLSSRFSLLPLEGGGAQRRRLAKLFSSSATPLPFGHPPSIGRG